MHEDPIGPEAMDYIQDMSRTGATAGSLIVACWGNHGQFMVGCNSSDLTVQQC